MRRSGHNRLRLIAILFAISGTPSVAEPLPPPAASTGQPKVHDVKVRPRNEQTDRGSPSTPYIGKALPDSDVKHVRTTRQPTTTDAKRIRTTRERADEPVPALEPLRPPAGQQQGAAR